MNIEVKIARARSEIQVNYIDIDISGFGSTSRNANNITGTKASVGMATILLLGTSTLLTQQ